MKDQDKISPDEHEESQGKHTRKSGTVASINNIINSPTDAVRSHHHTDTLGNTGTNISYEGATAPGGGGSVGTGQSSGQDAVGAKISTSNENDSATGHSKETEDEGNAEEGRRKDNLDRDTLGTP